MERPEIALLGGSFNPPHVAHLMAAYWVLATQGVAEVWLVPSFKHPFGKALAPFADRVRMCERAAAALRGVHVCEVEQELEGDPNVGRTVVTLERLVAKHPSKRFALVIGSDILGETAKSSAPASPPPGAGPSPAPPWYRFDRIKELARIIVVARQGYPVPEAHGPELPRVSSSEIRERVGRGESIDGLVPARVTAYIAEHGLYRPAG